MKYDFMEAHLIFIYYNIYIFTKKLLFTYMCAINQNRQCLYYMIFIFLFFLYTFLNFLQLLIL